MSETVGYELDEILFSSSKTIIQKAKRKLDNKQMVLKMSTETVPTMAVVESFKKDFQLTTMLHQSFPQQFINMIEMLPQKNGSVVLVEEFDGTGLQNILEKKVCFQEKEFLEIAKEMAFALHCAHSKQVLHGDIKVGNFVFTSNQTIKLIDFGFSSVVSRKSPSIACRNPTGKLFTFNTFNRHIFLYVTGTNWKNFKEHGL
jgi:serine/threonine protein kinase